jgi:ribosomal protein L37AE/L43A
MRDTPGDVTSTVVCPACEAETIEHQLLAEGEYRCLRCGATFDAGGGESPLADSDDPHTRNE